MSDFFNLFDKPKNKIDFNSIKISLASPEEIMSWSFGEVTKPETINYRTLKPEKDGLFCAKIFGPIKDYECICGKYKRLRHRGIVCEKCGVEVIESKVRRTRIGHIELACPVAHIWFLKSLPSRIATILDITLKELEKVLYFESYIVTDEGDTDLEFSEILSDKEYRLAREEHGADFEVSIGAEAVYQLLQKLDCNEIYTELKEEYKNTKSVAKKKRINKRLKVLASFLKSDNKPEWMILKVIPVIPPDLRPLVPLDAGRFATSDLNDLYRRVINRNNRLKRLLELQAPDIILRNEKRMLQEAVDALFANGKRGRVIQGPNKRPLKSLSDMLKGKTGRFRGNLLGKRVDYSGRSVIVAGPDLRLHQCGIPKLMALELFKPFIYNKLEERGYVTTIKSAKKMVEEKKAVVWDILDEVIKEHPVLLNRAPTLHRLGIQAFEPILIEGKAIRLHPLVCFAYNADFDGDQMAVHVPLSIEAQVEARVLMMSTNNILSPQNGLPVIVPSQDIVLGLYYMTRERPYAKGYGLSFSSPDEVYLAWESDVLDLQAAIKCRVDGEVYETTVGRVIAFFLAPPSIPFTSFNKVLGKKELSSLLDEAYRLSGNKATAILADRLKDIGYRFSTIAGISIGIDDMVIPASKTPVLGKADEKVAEIDSQYQEGLITSGERYNKVIDIWSEVADTISDDLMQNISTEKFKSSVKGEETKTEASFNSIYIMADSGARGSAQQIRQLAGMRGLMAKPDGSIIEQPIKANLREGLTVLQYFVSTHGARKGLADTALKTANSGYLTRKLVDVAQDCIITKHDCQTTLGVEMSALIEGGEEIDSLQNRIYGRVAAEDVRDSVTDEIILSRDELITDEKAELVSNSGIDTLYIRSVLTCESHHGVCQLCYGSDLGRRKLVNLGEAVGVIAAQSIGEPGTQLTMRTFHVGGAASGKAEQTALESRFSGTIKLDDVKVVTKKDKTQIVMSRKSDIIILSEDNRERERHTLVYGSKILVKEGQKIEAGDLLCEWDPFTIPMLSENEGTVEWVDINENTVEERTDERTGFVEREVIPTKVSTMRPRIIINSASGESRVYNLPVGVRVSVEHGQEVDFGDIIAKRERATTKTKDITGGLPRVVELFEARKPKDPAVVAEIDGVVKFGDDKRGKRVLIIEPEFGEAVDYAIAKNKHINIQAGDFVKSGETITDGAENPHDILRIDGINKLSNYLVNEIQQIYRLQGVRINDKHIEAIVRQMLKRVTITDSGDSDYLVGENILRFEVMDENERLLAEGKTPAKYDYLLMGITKASLSTNSFISAASFQETTKVLTQAALSSKQDNLVGLKENVIMGRLIPAGSGFSEYTNTEIIVESDEEVEVAKPKKLQISEASVESLAGLL